MVINSSVMFLNKNTNSINIVCLKTYKIKSISLSEKAQNATNMKIFPFWKTRFFCVVITLKQSNESKITLSYFDYNLLDIDEKPFETIQVADRHSQFNVFKLNDDSKVGWCRPNKECHQKISWSFYEICPHNQNVKKISTNTTIANLFGGYYKHIKIKRMQEFKRDHYVILAYMNQRAGCSTTGFKVISTQGGYIISPVSQLMEPYLSNTFRATSLCQVGDFTLIHSNGPKVNYYFDNEYEMVIATDVNEKTHQDIQSAGWDSRVLMRVHFYHSHQQIVKNRYSKRQFRLREKEGEGQIVEWNRFYVLKDIYMSFILHLNEDFDDDLIYDVIEMTTQL